MEPAFALAEPDAFDRFAAGNFGELDDDAKEEYWATLALRHCPGLGARSQAKLAKKFGTAVQICRSCKEWPSLGVSALSAENFASESWRPAAKKEWDCAKKSGAGILLWSGRDYPELLRELPDAPILLYFRGALSLLAGPCLAVVGARNPTIENARLTRALAGQIAASGITVVSGMALGIDREAHIAAMAEIGSSIGVLGTGMDIAYPRSNRDIYAQMARRGLLVSEFAPDTPPKAANFPIRNRIISGLSIGVVVVEAAERSGSLITARLALEQNRHVFAAAGSSASARSQGCANLICQGAKPVSSAEDILFDLAANLSGFAGSSRSRPATRRVKARKSLLSLTGEDGETRPRARRVKTQNNPLDLPGEDGETRRAQETDAAARQLLTKSDSEKILAVLAATDKAHADVLLEKTGLGPGELSVALLGLEMLGQINRLPGSFFEKA